MARSLGRSRRGDTSGDRPLVRWVRPSTPNVADQRRQQVALEAEPKEVSVPQEEGVDELQHRLALIHVRRERLLDLQDEGVYDATVLGQTLTSLDTAEVGLRLRQQTRPDR